MTPKKAPKKTIKKTTPKKAPKIVEKVEEVVEEIVETVEPEKIELSENKTMTKKDWISTVDEATPVVDTRAWKVHVVAIANHGSVEKWKEYRVSMKVYQRKPWLFKLI